MLRAAAPGVTGRPEARATPRRFAGLPREAPTSFEASWPEEAPTGRPNGLPDQAPGLHQAAPETRKASILSHQSAEEDGPSARPHL